MLPSPGWTGEHDWHGYIPFDEKPFALNPKSGYVVSANHKIAGDDYPHYLVRQEHQIRLLDPLQTDRKQKTNESP